MAQLDPLRDIVVEGDELFDAPLGEQVYEWLRRRIISGDIPPGTVLRETQLAQEAGVSRTPIRESLLRLSELGLVKRYAGRGSVVVEMSIQEIWECLDLQLCTETFSLRTILSGDHQAQIDADLLEGFIRNQEAALEQKQYWEVFQNDRAIHLQIVRWTENRRLVQIMSDVSELLIYGGYQTLRRRVRLEEALHEHRALIDALRRRDLEASIAASEEHVRNAKRRLLI